MIVIKNSPFENIVGPLAVGQTVSLFVISSNCQRLKKLNLEGLTPEERANKLKKFAQENRFVAVVESGDKVFAHAQAQRVSQLEKLEDLTLNGKKVTLHSLNDEEAQLLAKMGEELEDSQSVEDSNSKSESSTVVNSKKNLTVIEQNATSPYQSILLTQFVFKLKFSKIIDDCLEKFREARKEEQRVLEIELKHFEILRSEINRSILKDEIQKKEVVLQVIKEQI